MKIAVISDIHGNIDALKAVIEDIKSLNISKIFILGDLAMAGPYPAETIDYIVDLNKEFETVVIQGNTDEMIVKAKNEPNNPYIPPNKIMEEALWYSQKVLSPSHIEFLANLPAIKEEQIQNVKILLTHGSPRRNNEDIMPNLTDEKLKEIINSVNADIILCGHTHLPAIYKLDNQIILNTGSVGRPFTPRPHAAYAVIDLDSEINVYHRFIEYDYMKAAETLQKLDFVGADKLAQMLIKATSRYPE